MQISEQHLNIVTDLIPFADEYRPGLHSSLGGGKLWAWTITGPVSIGRVRGGSSHGGADRGPSPFGLHG